MDGMILNLPTILMLTFLTIVVFALRVPEMMLGYGFVMVVMILPMLIADIVDYVRGR